MLRSEAGQGDAQAAVRAVYERWYGGTAIDGEFVTHINGQLTFAEYITRGVSAYGANRLDEARDLFFSALGKNDTNYIPYYYIGLIAYADNDFPTADLYYKAALRLGSDQAITNYALGINAFAARNYDEARAYLVEASRLDPARYQVKVADLLNRLSDEIETNAAPATSGS
jgi:tetratricopeptide (TPR) repeat protein